MVRQKLGKKKNAQVDETPAPDAPKRTRKNNDAIKKAKKVEVLELPEKPSRRRLGRLKRKLAEADATGTPTTAAIQTRNGVTSSVASKDGRLVPQVMCANPDPDPQALPVGRNALAKNVRRRKRTKGKDTEPSTKRQRLEKPKPLKVMVDAQIDTAIDEMKTALDSSDASLAADTDSQYQQCVAEVNADRNFWLTPRTRYFVHLDTRGASDAYRQQLRSASQALSTVDVALWNDTWQVKPLRRVAECPFCFTEHPDHRSCVIRVCFRCLRRDHEVASCENADVVCTACHYRGHSEDECFNTFYHNTESAGKVTCIACDDVEEKRRGGPVRVRIQPPDAPMEFPEPSLNIKQGLLAPMKRATDNLRRKAAAYPQAKPLSVIAETPLSETRAPPALPMEFYDVVGSTEAEGALCDLLTHQKSLPTCQHVRSQTILEYGNLAEEEARLLEEGVFVASRADRIETIPTCQLFSADAAICGQRHEMKWVMFSAVTGALVDVPESVKVTTVFIEHELPMDESVRLQWIQSHTDNVLFLRYHKAERAATSVWTPVTAGGHQVSCWLGPHLLKTARVDVRPGPAFPAHCRLVGDIHIKEGEWTYFEVLAEDRWHNVLPAAKVPFVVSGLGGVKHVGTVKMGTSLLVECCVPEGFARVSCFLSVSLGQTVISGCPLELKPQHIPIGHIAPVSTLQEGIELRKQLKALKPPPLPLLPCLVDDSGVPESFAGTALLEDLITSLKLMGRVQQRLNLHVQETGKTDAYMERISSVKKQLEARVSLSQRMLDVERAETGRRASGVVWESGWLPTQHTPDKDALNSVMDVYMSDLATVKTQRRELQLQHETAISRIQEIRSERDKLVERNSNLLEELARRKNQACISINETVHELRHAQQELVRLSNETRRKAKRRHRSMLPPKAWDVEWPMELVLGPLEVGKRVRKHRFPQIPPTHFTEDSPEIRPLQGPGTSQTWPDDPTTIASKIFQGAYYQSKAVPRQQLPPTMTAGQPSPPQASPVPTVGRRPQPVKRRVVPPRFLVPAPGPSVGRS